MDANGIMGTSGEKYYELGTLSHWLACKSSGHRSRNPDLEKLIILPKNIQLLSDRNRF